MMSNQPFVERDRGKGKEEEKNHTKRLFININFTVYHLKKKISELSEM